MPARLLAAALLLLAASPSAAQTPLDPLSYGATGRGSATPIGATYGTTPDALAHYRDRRGAHPFAWAANPQFGLTFSLPTSAPQAAPGATLTFIETLNHNPTLPYIAQTATWLDPGHGNALLQPGMAVSGPGIAPGTTVAALPTVPVRAGELLPAIADTPAATDWAPSTAYPVNAVVQANGGVWKAIAAGTSGPGHVQPAAGTVLTHPVTTSTLAASPRATAANAYNPGAWNPASLGTTARASFSGTAMTVAATYAGAPFHIGQPITGAGLSGTPTLTAGSGPRWTLSTPQPTLPPETIAAGGTVQTDGSVTWLLVAPAETRWLPLGTVQLSQPTTHALPAGTPITFTLAPRQLEALTADWLGLQTAMAHAWLQPTGGAVHIPAGTFVINHPLLNPAGNNDSATPDFNIELHGDGPALTRITVPADLGQDACALVEGQRGPERGSQSAYSGFSLAGPRFTRVPGLSPSAMDGICVGRGAQLERLGLQGFHAGFVLVNDHQLLRDVVAQNNGCGGEMGFGSYAMGNQELDDGGLDGNTVCSMLVDPTGQFDGGNIKNVPIGFSPYGWYSPPAPPNVAATQGGLLSNTAITTMPIEAIGIGAVVARQPNGALGGNTLASAGPVGFLPSYSIGNGQGGTVPAAALIDVDAFEGNTLVGTSWAVYRFVQSAVIRTVAGCSNNLFLGDSALVAGNAYGGAPSASVVALSCGGPATGNSFTTPIGTGVFRPLASPGPVPAATPVANAAPLAMPYADGRPALGLTAAACPASPAALCPVYTTAASIPGVPVVGGVPIRAGQPVFFTNLANTAPPGIQPGLDPADAVGTALSDCTAACTVSLGPARGSTPGAATGLAATGTDAATALPLATAVASFATVPPGTGTQLAPVPIGRAITLYNDGANPLAVYPPGGARFAEPNLAALPAGASATYRRIAPGLWGITPSASPPPRPTSP